jgi:hypothetical protein
MRHLNTLVVVLALVALAGCGGDDGDSDEDMSAGDSITITFDGLGSGTVTHNLGPATCPAECTWDFTAGFEPTLTATPNPDSVFAGWGGDCAFAGTGDCTLTVNGQLNVTATFNLL